MNLSAQGAFISFFLLCCQHKVDSVGPAVYLSSEQFLPQNDFVITFGGLDRFVLKLWL